MDLDKQRIQGQRLKEQAARLGITAKMLTEYFCYENAKSIYNLYSGKRKIQIEGLKRFCNTFGIREEYILGDDDFPTLEQYEEFKQGQKYKHSLPPLISDNDEDCLMKILRHHGLNVRYGVYWVVSSLQIPANVAEAMKEYLTDNAKGFLEKYANSDDVIDYPIYLGIRKLPHGVALPASNKLVSLSYFSGIASDLQCVEICRRLFIPSINKTFPADYLNTLILTLSSGIVSAARSYFENLGSDSILSDDIELSLF